MGRTVAIRKLVNNAPASWEYYVNGAEREAKLTISAYDGNVVANDNVTEIIPNPGPMVIPAMNGIPPGLLGSDGVRSLIRNMARYISQNPNSTIFIYGGTLPQNVSATNATQIQNALTNAGVPITNITIIPFVPGVPAPAMANPNVWTTFWAVP